MTYEFRDMAPYKGPSDTHSPESITVDGVELEAALPSFTTLGVSGRELLEKDITTTKVGNRDGEVFRESRRPMRTITVDYQLRADNPADFRRQFEEMTTLLDKEQIRISFADKPGYYYTATFQSAGDIDPGRLDIVGSLTFLCSDPHAYAETPVTFTSVGDTITVTNSGNCPTPVSFNIKNKDDNGFVALVAPTGIVQAGRPDEIDGVAYSNSEQRLFNTWESPTELAPWVLNTHNPLYYNPDTKVGSYATKKGTHGDWCLYPKFATGSNPYKWYGPSFYRDFLPNSKGSPTADNFRFNTVIQAKGASNSCGIVELSILDSAGKGVCGFRFRKMNWATFDMQLYFYVGDTIFQKWEGPTAWIMKNFLGSIVIEKNGNHFTFQVDNNTTKSRGTYHYIDEAAGALKAKGVVYWTSEAGSMRGMDPQLFMLQVRETVSGWKDTANSFGKGDELNILCTDYRVETYLNQSLSLDLQDVGAEPILVPVGTSEIKISQSTFAQTPDVVASLTNRFI